jgi:hypothetical protein
MFEDNGILIDRKMVAKNNKILLFTDQSAAHSKKTFLWGTNICFPQLTVPANYSLELQESSVQSSIITENISLNRLLS